MRVFYHASLCFTKKKPFTEAKGFSGKMKDEL